MVYMLQPRFGQVAACPSFSIDRGLLGSGAAGSSGSSPGAVVPASEVSVT